MKIKTLISQEEIFQKISEIAKRLDQDYQPELRVYFPDIQGLFPILLLFFLDNSAFGYDLQKNRGNLIKNPSESKETKPEVQVIKERISSLL